MRFFEKLNGIQPELKPEVVLRDKAMAGDLVFVVTPTTLDSAVITGAWTRKVIVELKTATGEVHTWFNRAITSGVSIADTSALGTATIPSTTLTFVDGKAEVTITGSNHAWANTETDTLTVAQATILGYTVASKTSVETFKA